MKTNEPHLDAIGNKVPFAVPEHYFEDFAAMMDAHIAAQEVTVRKVIRPWMYLAAMFVGLFLVGNVFYYLHQNKNLLNEELYEMYVMSQVDEAIFFDYYFQEGYSADVKNGDYLNGDDD